MQQTGSASEVTPSREGGAPDEVLVAETRLEGGALRLPEALMQGITETAPAFTLFFFVQATVALAVGAAPFAYIVGVVIMVMLAVTLAQIARYLSSAGGFFTWISRGLHPRWGWFIAWLYALYTPLLPGLVLGLVGYISDQFFKANYGFSLPWWVWVLGGVTLCALVSYRGIKLSGRLLLITGSVEIIIMMALGIWSIASPGKGGFNLSGFNPSSSPTTHGIYLAVVFSVVAYTGWESVASLGEETENPNRNIGIGMWGSVLALGLLFSLFTWAVLVGWGTDHAATFGVATNNPLLTLAHRYWHGADIILLVALWNSGFAGALALFNQSTRMWFGMANAGALPKQLKYVHPKYKTPVGTVVTELIVALVAAGIIYGILYNPLTGFGFYAFALSFAIVLIYASASIATGVYFWRERRSQFNWVLHLLFPLVVTAALIFVQYKSVVPLPPAPTKYGLWVFIGWAVVGVVVLIAMRLAGKEDWLIHAGEAAVLRPETPQELEHRPAV
ncbi:MAG TPA: APC family permease [Solirubrobacteraceae bacterium]|jgi:amino acid transporter